MLELGPVLNVPNAGANDGQHSVTSTRYYALDDDNNSFSAAS